MRRGGDRASNCIFGRTLLALCPLSTMRERAALVRQTIDEGDLPIMEIGPLEVLFENRPARSADTEEPSSRVFRGERSWSLLHDCSTAPLRRVRRPITAKQRVRRARNTDARRASSE